MCTIYFDEAMLDDLRRQRLYGGDIFVYSPTSSSLELSEFAQQFCRDYFAPHDPVTAQYELSMDEYKTLLAKLKPEFIHHSECKRLIPAILQELGCDLVKTYFDVPRIRTVTGGDFLKSGLAYVFKPHRDTWYSTPMCQLNWWLPIFPIE